MPHNNDAQSLPQFQTAEFHEPPPAGDACCVCRQPIVGSYYRLNGSMACPACSQRIQSQRPVDTHAAFSRAILFGLGGALLGLILYSAVGILLHIEIGYVSLAVGYLVARAMMMGSGNIGGRRYQYLAVALTYAAVSLSAIPMGIASYVQHRPSNAQVEKSKAPASPQDASNSADAPESSTPSLGKVLGILLLYGLASPFLELSGNFVSGALGLVILLVGTRIAWRMTSGPPRLTVEGPY